MLLPSEKSPDINPTLKSENVEIRLLYKSCRQSGASRSANSARNTTVVKVRRIRAHVVLLEEGLAELGARSTKR